MNEERQQLNYAHGPRPVHGPTVADHITDAITLGVIALDAAIVGYGVVHGWGFGAGGAVCLILMSLPLLLILVLLRARDSNRRTLLFYLNAVVVGILVLIFIGTLFKAALPSF